MRSTARIATWRIVVVVIYRYYSSISAHSVTHVHRRRTDGRRRWRYNIIVFTRPYARWRPDVSACPSTACAYNEIEVSWNGIRRGTALRCDEDYLGYDYSSTRLIWFTCSYLIYVSTPPLVSVISRITLDTARPGARCNKLVFCSSVLTRFPSPLCLFMLYYYYALCATIKT